MSIIMSIITGAIRRLIEIVKGHQPHEPYEKQPLLEIEEHQSHGKKPYEKDVLILIDDPEPSPPPLPPRPIFALLDRTAEIMLQSSLAATSDYLENIFYTSQPWDTVVDDFKLVDDDTLVRMLRQSVEQFAHVDPDMPMGAKVDQFRSFVSICNSFLLMPVDAEADPKVTTRLTRLFTSCATTFDSSLWPSCWALFTHSLQNRAEQYLRILVETAGVKKVKSSFSGEMTRNLEDTLYVGHLYQATMEISKLECSKGFRTLKSSRDDSSIYAWSYFLLEKFA